MFFLINGKESTLSDLHDQLLARAVVISLFSDKRATEDEVPDGGGRRGWWGDTYADNKGDQIGSKLWLLQREKLTNETIMKAKEYTEEALQWLITDRVVKRIDVTAERFGADGLTIDVQLYKPDMKETNVRFQDVWRI